MSDKFDGRKGAHHTDRKRASSTETAFLHCSGLKTASERPLMATRQEERTIPTATDSTDTESYGVHKRRRFLPKTGCELVSNEEGRYGFIKGNPKSLQNRKQNSPKVAMNEKRGQIENYKKPNKIESWGRERWESNKHQGAQKKNRWKR